ncbi:MAG: glycosyltransferase family 4 protein [Actinobacteria bacterium]|nr:glycosyltransferase family 4 protein [Actinomycetota bacterium]
MKRVGINLLWMVPGVVGGSETYMTRLLSGLAERTSNIEYTLFALPQLQTSHPELERNFQIAYAPVTGQWKSFRVAGENSWLARQCRRRRIHLVHHAGGVVPFIRRSRPLLTIHDLQYLFFPEYFTKAKLAYLRVMVPRSAETARLVLTPSEYTRRTVIERLNIDPSVVIVVPHGISLRPTRTTSGDVRQRYGLEGPFFLYPAANYPHKNHLLLIDAFARLAQVHPDTMLVFTGARAGAEWSVARAMGERISAEIRKGRIEGRVKRLGYVPAEDLDALYQEAIAVTFPSRFEGFGAPALEAMARACPVIASNVTALPEVVGNAGYLVSPDNSEEWTKAMSDMLEDEDLRMIYVKSGPERAREFGWGRSAKILEEAYLHALETTL